MPFGAFFALLPIFAVVDFYVVVILEVFLFVALSFATMPFEFLTGGFFCLCGESVVLNFVDGRKSCFFVVHIRSLYVRYHRAENVCKSPLCCRLP